MIVIVSSSVVYYQGNILRVGQVLHSLQYRAKNDEKCSKRSPLWNMEGVCGNILIIHEEETISWKTIADG